jgi:tRNA threonylcarbamoyladenosine biosynthesis protein TsaB
MYKLLVDSSTKTLYIALVLDNKVLEEMYIEGRNDHAKNIVSKIDEILKNNNIKVEDLEGVYVGVGPGSYTGVRMAVTVGKMIATNTNVLLYGFSSLYMQQSGYDGKVLSYIDARRGNSFNVVYNNGSEEISEGMRSTTEMFLNYPDYKVVSEDNIKVNPIKVINHSTLCKNPHGFVPNYLRETEAERNLHHD